MNRREFLASAAGATGTVAVGSTVAPRRSPVGRARAAVPLVPIGVAAAAAAIDYVVREGVELITGDDAPNQEEYQEYDSAQTHLEIYERQMTMNGGDDTVATVMGNRIEDSYNSAWSIGKEAAVEKLNAGASQSDAETAAKDAVNDYYTTIQTNLVNHFIEQVNKIKVFRDMVADDANLAYQDVFRYGVSGSVTYQPPEWPSETLTFEDGTTQSVDGFQLRAESDGSTTTYLTRWRLGSGVGHGDQNVDGGYVPPEGYNDGEYTEAIYPFNWDGANNAPSFGLADRWTDVKNAAQQMRDNLVAWVDSLYAEYEPGELSLSGYMNASEIASQYGTEYDDTGYYAFAAAELAALGLSGSFEQFLKLHLHDSDIVVEGVLFSENQPGAGWEVGKRYDPTSYTGETWLAYEYLNDDGEEVSDLVELTQEFSIVDAEDADGNNLDAVKLEEKNYQTSDVTMTQEELDQLYELRKELEDARDAAAFAGAAAGGAADGDLPFGLTKGQAAAGVGGAGLLWFLGGGS